MITFARRLCSTLIILTALVVTQLQALQKNKSNSEQQKAVLITGASTGNGRMLAETLAAKGYLVYAGARKDKDLKELNAVHNIHSIKLDVTIQSEIDNAVKTISDSGTGLYALVNNAGVGLMAPLIEAEENDLNFIFNVNIYGPYRLSKAFAPLLIQSKGRIINIGSIAGFQTAPFYGPYSMSKHALEAFTDALSIEMQKFNVKVSIVDPGGFNSNIGKNIYNRLKAKGMDFEKSLYKEEWKSNWVISGGDLSSMNGPEKIVERTLHALFDKNPQKRYMVVGDSGRADRTMRALLQRMLQLNANQKFTYNREELRKLLDEEMAKIR